MDIRLPYVYRNTLQLWTHPLYEVVEVTQQTDALSCTGTRCFAKADQARATSCESVQAQR